MSRRLKKSALLRWLYNNCVPTILVKPVNNHKHPFYEAPLTQIPIIQVPSIDFPPKKSCDLWNKPKTRVRVVVSITTFALQALREPYSLC